jgi:hypothetical protein
MWKTIVALSAVALAFAASGVAHAEDAAPSTPKPPAIAEPPAPPPNELPAGFVAVPPQLVNSLLIYLADRSDVARNLGQALSVAATTKPTACPNK